MLTILGTALAITIIAACISPFYYCKKSSQRDDKSESIESQSPLVHIKISHPHQDQSFSRIVYDTPNGVRRVSIDSHKYKDTAEVTRQDGPVSMGEARIVPAKPPRNRRRVSSQIWSSVLRDQLENITNSSSEVCGSRKVVRAQVEANLGNSTKNEPFKSLPYEYSNSRRISSNRNNWIDEKARKQLSGVAKRWKNLKRTLICSRANQSAKLNAFEDDDSQRLNIPPPTMNRCSTLDRSRILPKRRFVDVSTSTRISSNVSHTCARNDEIPGNPTVNPANNVDVSPKESENVRRTIDNRNVETSQDVVSLIKRQTINGKSICDVKISGLAMTQAQLLDLFEASDGMARSASIVTTEEASIISIKFHRRRSGSNDSAYWNSTSFYECPLRKLYRSLPEILEDLSISKLFRSNKVSQRTTRVSPSVPGSNRSRTMNNSRNETSYVDFPKKLITEGTRFNRSETLSKRISNNHVPRFFEERRI